MSLARICTLHDLSLCRHDVYAIAHHGFEPLLRPILPFLASTYSATVTIAHKHQLSINERRMICHLLVDDI